MQTVEDVVATQLERVNPRLERAYDIDDTYFSQAEKRPVQVISSRDMRVPLKIRPGGRFGYYNPASGDLGLGSSTKYEKGVITAVHFKHAIQWDLESEITTDDKRKAVINSVQENLTDAMDEFRRQSDAQCMTAGTGVLATVTSVSSSGGVDTVTCTTDGYGSKLLRYGQRVSIYDSARTTNRTLGGPVEISEVDYENKTFKIPTVSGLTGTDVVLPEGLTGSTPVGLFGHPYHASNASTGTWLGLNRATFPEIRASRVNANSSGLAWHMARLAVNKIADKVGKKNIKPTAWMHPAQQQAYENLGQLVSIIQKQARDEKMNLYFDGFQIAGCPVETSYLWDRKRIDFVLMDLIGRAELKGIRWHTVGGRKIFELRGSTGGVAASSISYLLADWNLFHQNPGAGSYIDGLTVPDGY